MDLKDVDITSKKRDTVFITKDSHKYCRGSNCEKQYTSVSEVIGRYKIPYNSNYWSKYKGYQKILVDRLKLIHPNRSDAVLDKLAKDTIKSDMLEFLLSEDTNVTSSTIGGMENDTALSYSILKSKVSPRELDDSINEILALWKNKKDVASNKGNIYHRGREINAINNGFEVNAFDNKSYPLHLKKLIEAYHIEPGAFETVEDALTWGLDFSDEKRSLTDDPHKDLPDGFYPELILSDDEYMVAGTSDRVFFETILGQRFVDIDDYKTNADIPKKSFYVRGQGYKMMNYPVDHLMDCKHSYYHLQVSIYAYLLERKGFTVRRVGYHHLNSLVECTYLRSEAQDVLEDYKEYRTRLNNRNNI